MLAALFSGAAGCAELPPPAPDRWSAAPENWSLVRDGLRLDFTLKPPSPDETQETELKLSITDLSGPEPGAVTEAEVKGKALMPRRPGHIHVLALRPLHSGDSPGVYAMRLVFGMGGEWEARFTVRLPSGKTVETAFPFMVSGSDVPPWEREKVNSK